MKVKSKILIFINDNNEVIMEKRLTALPLKESCMIEKSIEFFNDPEPCMIHRSAVMKRIYLEFNYYIDTIIEEGKDEVLWNKMPSRFKSMLDIKSNIHKIIIR